VKFFFLSTPVLALLTGTALAQEPDDERPLQTAAPAAVCEQAITVFQDVSGVGRKDRAARNMSRKHAAMAEDGWRFADMEVYTENGDLEGFYLTYVRDSACPESPAKQ
jgi:hypothetical protein